MLRAAFTAFATLLLAACGGESDKDDPTPQGVELSLWGNPVYLEDKAYELNCHLTSVFVVNALNACVATTVDTEFADGATSKIIATATGTHYVNAEVLNGARLKIQDSTYQCLFFDGEQYAASGAKLDGFAGHTVLVPEAVAKPSQLDASKIFAIYAMDAEFCAGFKSP